MIVVVSQKRIIYTVDYYDGVIHRDVEQLASYFAVVDVANHS